MSDILIPGGLLGRGVPPFLVEEVSQGSIIEVLPGGLLGRNIPAIYLGTDGVIAQVSISFTDGTAFTDTITNGFVISWAEEVGLGEELTQVLVGSAEFVEALELAEVLGVGSLVELVETLTLGDAGLDGLLSAIVFSEILQVSESLTELPNFTPTFVSAITLLDVLNTGRDLELTDGLTVGDVLTDLLEATIAATEAVALSDALSNTLAIFTTLSDGMELGEELTPQAFFQVLLDDALLCGMEITLDGQEYVAWVMNPQNKAFTRYTNWEFNSFVPLGQDAYGLRDEGIFLLEGDDDAGTNIPIRVASGLMDFGTPEQSNLRHAYMGVVSGGDLVLKVVSTEKGQRTEDHYRLRGMTGDATFETVQTFSNAVQARFWRFEVENVLGEELELDGIDWRVVKLRRKVSGRGRG